MRCGLLGRKLGHSYSPQIHALLGNYSYTLFEKEPCQLEAFFRSEHLTGLNVTVPYKKAVIAYCDRLTDRARALGAVNTIIRDKNGVMTGHNTDYFGFSSMLDRSNIEIIGKKVLVLGSGGASATAEAVLKARGSNVIVISRTGEHNYQNLYLHSDAVLIVNTTPVGMYPDVAQRPLDLSIFPCLDGVLDLIYNPSNTRLLQQAQSRGIYSQNGLWMLVAQAVESARWFTGEPIADSVIDSIYRKLRLQILNLILIGMPGSGKSTIGRLLAQKLNRQYMDSDEEIERNAGRSISDILMNQGEKVFRDLETTVLKNLGMQSGMVIATGGGCVTQRENYTHLHQNGIIIWLQREIDKLPVDGRPLSQAGSLSEMYMHREPMYREFSDIVINNHAAPSETVNQILYELQEGEWL